jgi:thioredoxin:protein disulfide reductase
MMVPHVRSFSTISITGLLVAGMIGANAAQVRQVKAELTPIVETTSIRAGESALVTLRVKLADGLHVQSNAPRDPALISTALTVDAPTGVVVERIAYPAASDLAQQGQRQPLAVFGQDFSISVHLAVSKEVAAGEVVVPARLRYQACNESICYPPTRAETRWTLNVE